MYLISLLVVILTFSVFSHVLSIRTSTSTRISPKWLTKPRSNFPILMRTNRLDMGDVEVFGALKKLCLTTTASVVGLGIFNCALSSNIPFIGGANAFKVDAKEKSNLKSDSQFEVCISKCVFMETKPPPVGSTAERLEVKSRNEAMMDCKKKCAKSPEQLLLGQPKAKTTTAPEQQ